MSSAGKPERKTQVREQQEALSGKINALVNELDNLETRLTPVLVSVPSEAVEKAEVPETGLVEAADYLRSRAQLIDNLVWKTKSMCERLEL